MSATKYDIDVDLGNEGTSHRHMVDMVGANNRVLDVGCATGYLAKTLRAFGNTIVGVEFDPVAAEIARPFTERVIVADLDHADLSTELAGEQFDVIVFGDVLEHLRDPLPPLRQAKSLLAPGGYIVISIPNVAHGDVRMSLLLGRFPYRNLGLLDTTHLRFFTRANLRELLADAGFVAIEVRPTKAPLFGTELEVRPDEVAPEVVDLIRADPDSEIYQFVLTAMPRDATALAADAAWQAQQNAFQVRSLQVELDEANRKIALVVGELANAQESNVQLQAQIDSLAERLEAAALTERELSTLRATRTLRTRSATLRMMGRG